MAPSDAAKRVRSFILIVLQMSAFEEIVGCKVAREMKVFELVVQKVFEGFREG